jgi:hypothetical protein
MDRIEEIEKAEEEAKVPSMEEAIKGYRELSLGKYGNVRLHRPTQFIIDAADRIIAGMRFTMLKGKDIPTESELKKLYKEREAWTPEMESEMNALSTKILMLAKEIRDQKLGNNLLTKGVWIDLSDVTANEAFGKLNTMREEDDGYQDAMAIYKLERQNCFKIAQGRYSELRNIYNELFSNTIETFMNYERQLYYCIRCFKYEDGKYLWDSVDAFKEDIEVFFVALQEAINFWNDLGSEEASYFFEVMQGAPMPD